MRRIGIVMSVVTALGLWLAAPALAQQYQPEPEISCSPTTVTAGATVTVSGSNWLPGSEVTITFSSDPVVVGTATVGEDGTFSTQVQIPSDATAGTHALTVSGLDLNGDPASVSCQVVVVAAGAPPGEVAITGTNISLGLVILGILIASGLGFLVASRRKKATTSNS